MSKALRGIKYKIISFLPPKLYWFFAGLLNPYSSAIEGEKDKKNFYRLGGYELGLFKKIGIIQKNNRTLEIGCGPGRIQKALIKSDLKLRVYGTDFSSSMIAKAKKNVKRAFFCVGNGKDLKQYKNDFFDLIYSFVVFQHVDETILDNYLEEIYRTLKKDGNLCFQIQSSENIKNYQRPVKHPWQLRRYNRKEIFNKLYKNKFINSKLFNMLGERNPNRVDNSGFLFLAQK